MGQSMLWLTPAGEEMAEHDWSNAFARCLGLLLYAEGFLDVDRYGRQVRDEEFLWLMNAHYESIDFVLPHRGGIWRRLLDTAVDPSGETETAPIHSPYPLRGRSLALLILETSK